MNTIIAALIGAAAAVIVQLLVNHAARKQADAKQAAHDQEIADRLARIEENQQSAKQDNDERLGRIECKLDEHNHYAARLSSIETDLAWLRNAAQSK